MIRNVQSGNILGAILAASNTYNNAKKIKKSGVKEELKGIAKEGVLEVGKQAGTITNPVGSFSVGAVVAAGAAVAVAKSNSDNKKKKSDTRVISTPTLDTTNYLTAEESYNLITTDETIKDEIASYIYFKDIGSRNDLTVAESDVEYTASSDTVKTVYRNKAITDIRTLVTEGFLKIDRNTQNVSIATEKASL